MESAGQIEEGLNTTSRRRKIHAKLTEINENWKEIKKMSMMVMPCNCPYVPLGSKGTTTNTCS